MAMSNGTVFTSAQIAQTESVSASTPPLRHSDWCRLHSSCMRTLAHQNVSDTHIYTHKYMCIGMSRSLLHCLLLQPAFDLFSQLLALLSVPLSKKAHNAWYTHTQMTNSRSTGATRRSTNVTSSRSTEAPGKHDAICLCPRAISSSTFLSRTFRCLFQNYTHNNICTCICI